MPRHIRLKAQAKKARSTVYYKRELQAAKRQISALRRERDQLKKAIRRLQKTGLYTGKVDLRRKPTKYQRNLIDKFRDVITGRAVVLKPKNAKSYKSLFRVIADKVIVPRRKGEKIKVTKRGALVGERRVGGRIVRSRFRRVKPGKELPKAGTATMYFVPFIKGSDAKGKPIIEWKRFPSKSMLQTFMEGYDYKDWTNYVVEENVDIYHKYTTTADLQDRLNKKLGIKKRRRIKFDDEDEE